MARVFRSWDVDQGWLLPPSLHEFVPPGHMSHFVRDTVREALDLSAILDTYTEERGYPPYHPGMMVALLLYGYSRGLYSSRQLARACEERVDVMAVTGLNRPDFRTIAEFRKRHLVALSDLFVQALRLCRAAGLVAFAHVAVDGTKRSANASRHKAMSYGRMKTAEPALAAEVDAWLERARLTRPRIRLMAWTCAATRRRTGWPTSSGGWKRSAPLRPRWKRRRLTRPIRRTRAGRVPRRGCADRAGHCAGRMAVRPTGRSATSLTRTAGSSPRVMASCRATTARSRSIPRIR
ncbi:Transposase [Methylobacterium sp. UNCCL125]|jgi:transposase|nr:Transposase [Methylobacterium sp. UNCCL125]